MNIIEKTDESVIYSIFWVFALEFYSNRFIYFAFKMDWNRL